MLGLSCSDACVWGKGKATSGAKGMEEYIPDAPLHITHYFC
jgi:hypothetical protein